MHCRVTERTGVWEPDVLPRLTLLLVLQLLVHEHQAVLVLRVAQAEGVGQERGRRLDPLAEVVLCLQWDQHVRFHPQRLRDIAVPEQVERAERAFRRLADRFGRLLDLLVGEVTQELDGIEHVRFPHAVRAHEARQGSEEDVDVPQVLEASDADAEQHEGQSIRCTQALAVRAPEHRRVAFRLMSQDVELHLTPGTPEQPSCE